MTDTDVAAIRDKALKHIERCDEVFDGNVVRRDREFAYHQVRALALELLDELVSLSPSLHFEKEDQHQFDYDRLGILAQAVGIARQQLRDSTPEKALATLDSAVDATLKLHREALISIGMDAEIVDSFLGLAR